MAYHIFIPGDASGESFLLDRYLGSATTVWIYWESVGWKLKLPFIASITEMADSEDGFVVFGENLVVFRNEVEELERYWIKGDEVYGVPDGFLDGVRKVIDGVDEAINNGLTLYIG